MTIWKSKKTYIIRVHGTKDKYGEPQASEYVVTTKKNLRINDVYKFLKEHNDEWLNYWEKENFEPPIEYYRMQTFTI